MKIIKPNEIAAAMLTGSSAPETDPGGYNGGFAYAADALASIAGLGGLITVYQSLQASNTGHYPVTAPAWWRLYGTLYQAYNPGAAYAVGDRVQDNTAHMVYQSLAAGNAGNALADTTKWVPVGATNRWAMFDAGVGTSTAVASPLAVVLRPGATSGLGLLDMVGRTLHVQMRDAPGGTVVYDRTLDLDASVVECVFDWFFAEFEQRADVAFTDLPSQFVSCELSVTLTASTGLASCGVCKPGRTIEIGRTLDRPNVSIIDYSVKSTDEFGSTTVIERTWSKRATFQVITEKYRFNTIYRALAALRATPAFYIGVDELGYEPLLLYGFFRDSSMSVEKPRNVCSIEVEGLSQ